MFAIYPPQLFEHLFDKNTANGNMNSKMIWLNDKSSKGTYIVGFLNQFHHISLYIIYIRAIMISLKLIIYK